MKTLSIDKLLPFAISALLLGISLIYPQSLGWVSLIALIPIIQVVVNSRKESFMQELWVFGFLFSLLATHYFISTYPLDWLSIYNPYVSLTVIWGIWISFSVTLAIPTMFWIYLTNKVKCPDILTKAIVASSVWSILEFFRSLFIAISLYGDGAVFGPHHTYYSIGYTIAHVPFLKETLPMGGIYLTGFFVILSNFLIYQLYQNWKTKSKWSKETKILSLVILTIILVSNLSLWIIRSSDTNSPRVSTSVLNTNFPSGTSYTIEDRDFVNTIAPNGVADLSDIVISPEGFQLDTLFKAPSQDSKQLFIGTTGSSSGQILYFNEFKNRTKYYTSKNILMPIGDYRLWWTDLILKQTQTEKWFTGYVKRYTTKKDLPHNLYSDPDSSLVIVGTVCSDNISPYIYRNATKEGANLLVNIASHAPFRGSTLLSRQTVSINSTRALESGRYFVTAANFDMSTVINDRGQLTYTSNSDALVSFATTEVKLKSYTTPYTKFGNYILYISLFIFLFYWLRKTKQ